MSKKLTWTVGWAALTLLNVAIGAQFLYLQWLLIRIFASSGIPLWLLVVGAAASVVLCVLVVYCSVLWRRRPELEAYVRTTSQALIIAVYVIVAVMVIPTLSLLTPIYKLAENQMNRGRTIAELGELRTAVIRYKSEFGRYPGTLRDLTQVTNDAPMPFVDDLDHDAWGERLVFASRDDGFVIVSSGNNRVQDIHDPWAIRVVGIDGVDRSQGTDWLGDDIVASDLRVHRAESP